MNTCSLPAPGAKLAMLVAAAKEERSLCLGETIGGIDRGTVLELYREARSEKDSNTARIFELQARNRVLRASITLQGLADKFECHRGTISRIIWPKTKTAKDL